MSASPASSTNVNENQEDEERRKRHRSERFHSNFYEDDEEREIHPFMRQFLLQKEKDRRLEEMIIAFEEGGRQIEIANRVRRIDAKDGEKEGKYY